MKYKLIIKEDTPTITIDESVKEDFKKVMGWSEEKFNSLTEKIIENKNIEIIDEELQRITSEFGTSVVGKLRCEGALGLANLLRIKFKYEELKEVGD